MIQLLLVIAVVGLIVYVLGYRLPMPEPFRTLLVGVATICVLLLILQFFGVVGSGWNWGGYGHHG